MKFLIEVDDLPEETKKMVASSLEGMLGVKHCVRMPDDTPIPAKELPGKMELKVIKPKENRFFNLLKRLIPPYK